MFVIYEYFFSKILLTFFFNSSKSVLTEKIFVDWPIRNLFSKQKVNIKKLTADISLKNIRKLLIFWWIRCHECITTYKICWERYHRKYVTTHLIIFYQYFTTHIMYYICTIYRTLQKLMEFFFSRRTYCLSAMMLLLMLYLYCQLQGGVYDHSNQGLKILEL